MNEFEYRRTLPVDREAIQAWDETTLRRHQLSRINNLLQAIIPRNSFYVDKLAGKNGPLLDLGELADLPLTTKQDLIDVDDAAGFARNLTFAREAYTRFHRTSGTRGRPMIVLDTPRDWDWWMEAWQYVLDSAKLQSSDRVLMAFSFGPFIGFWSAFDAVVERGAMAIPTGAMSSLARLELLGSTQATVVFCTPSYAIHLAQLAAENGIDLRATKVSRIVVAGEPGGSIPAIKDRIESAWGATVIDHCGASEVGPWGIAGPAGQGILVNEAEFIPEFIPVGEDNAWLRPDRRSDQGRTSASDCAEPPPIYELVLTCLGRIGSPVIRYRTGDLVRPQWPQPNNGGFVDLIGGVIGRADDMMIIRGVNVFPSSIDQIVRGFGEVVEYRMTAFKTGAMSQLKVEVETIDLPRGHDLLPKMHQALEAKLGVRIDVEKVDAGSLPRFESKGKRFIDNR